MKLPTVSPLGVCAWFCFLSTILTLHNKYVLDDIFRSSNGVLTCQCVFSISTLFMLRQLGYVSHFHASPFTATRMELFCAFCASINVVTGLGALAFVNVVTHGVLKRIAIVASWLIEFFFARKETTTSVIPAVVILIFGSVVAGYGDLKFSFIGYTLAIISCFAQGAMFELGRILVSTNSNNTNSSNNSSNSSGYQKSSAEQEKESALSSSSSSSSYSAVLYLNSMATIFVAAPLFLINATSTAKGSIESPNDESNIFVNPKIMPRGVSSAILHLFFNGFISLLMNHAIFWNCAVNSSLAHTVAGNLKAALQTIFGWILFETPLNQTGWIGVFFNILGAATFSVIRLRAKFSSVVGNPAPDSGKEKEPIVIVTDNNKL